jgi:hypothetical protein
VGRYKLSNELLRDVQRGNSLMGVKISIQKENTAAVI